MFSHHISVNMLGIESRPFPNPLSYPASNSTVIDLAGETIYVERPEQLPPFFKEIQECWAKALEEGAGFSSLRQAIRERDTAGVKHIWNQLVPIWDDRTFYDFVATSYAFGQKSFRHREVFGQVGFGTGGWDSDYPNSMLEILRVVCTDCDENQRFMVGGVEQVPRRPRLPRLLRRELAGRDVDAPLALERHEPIGQPQLGLRRRQRAIRQLIHHRIGPQIAPEEHRRP